MNFRWILYILIALSLKTCISFDQPYNKIAPGIWRGLLYLDGKEIIQKEVTMEEVRSRSYDVVQDGVLPFMFEVIYATPDSFYIEIINGEERIPITDIEFGNDLETARDTMVLQFPLYNSHIRTIVRERIMQGVFVNNDKSDYQLTFEAYQGQNFQYTTINNRPEADFSGKWKVTFAPETEDAYPAVGEFEQNGAHIEGTFRTETGDYRYLSGDVVDGKMYMGCFDGSHLFRFEGKMFKDTLVGLFQSGSHYQSTWQAVRDAEFKLSSPDSITQLTAANQKLKLSLPDTEGKIVNLEEDKYSGKYKIVQILGTWCPNCRDETTFLTEYLKKNPDLPIDVIGVGFERGDTQQKMQRLRQYKDIMNIPYTLVLGGDASKEAASAMFPMIDAVSAFPTMLILNKNNEVVHIHTGFDGPATSKYKQFATDFDQKIKSLLQNQ